jgi:hypothetical protein
MKNIVFWDVTPCGFSLTFFLAVSFRLADGGDMFLGKASSCKSHTASQATTDSFEFSLDS